MACSLPHAVCCLLSAPTIPQLSGGMNVPAARLEPLQHLLCALEFCSHCGYGEDVGVQW
jgi:hypothetical protein